MAAGCGLGMAGQPTSADDIIRAANDRSAHETQVSVVSNYAKASKYEIYPSKSKTVIFRVMGENNLAMDDCPIPVVQSLTHPGIERYCDYMSPNQLHSMMTRSKQRGKQPTRKKCDKFFLVKTLSY